MDPSTGTFTSMDTYSGNRNDPMSLHKYLFANANPIKYSDPSGHMSLNEETAVMIADHIISVALSVTEEICMRMVMEKAKPEDERKNNKFFAWDVVTGVSERLFTTFMWIGIGLVLKYISLFLGFVVIISILLGINNIIRGSMQISDAIDYLTDDDPNNDDIGLAMLYWGTVKTSWNIAKTTDSAGTYLKNYGEAYKQDDSLREMQATITPLTPTDLPPAVAVAQSNPPTDSSVAVVTPLYVDPGSIPDDAIVG